MLVPKRVPQGSILIPLFFGLHNMDINKEINDCQFDDTY